MLLGGPELLLLFSLSFVSLLIGSHAGRKYGRIGTPLLHSCWLGLLRSTLLNAIITYAIIALYAFDSVMNGGGLQSLLGPLVLGLATAPILGLISSLIPAPIATFIAYNFAARERAEAEIARQQSAPPDVRPS